jgi:hypothetical protein
MMETTDTPTPPRRKRFQFSLRTLMICVLVYGFLWVLTIKWGANQLARNQVDEIEKLGIHAEIGKADGSMSITFPGNPEFSVAESTTSPGPFILYCRIRNITSREDVEEVTYFWFFGYVTKISDTRSPKLGWILRK